MRKTPEIKPRKQVLSIAVNDELRRKIEAASQSEHRTMSNWIKLQIERALSQSTSKQSTAA